MGDRLDDIVKAYPTKEFFLEMFTRDISLAGR
jgi:hypothetical protein